MSSRKAEMILELVDRATRPARRFMALQQRMGRAIEDTNRAAVRSAGKAERAAGKAERVFTKLAKTGQKAFRTVGEGARRAGRAIRALHDKTVRLGKFGFSQIGQGWNRARGGLLAGAAAITIAYGGAAAAASGLVGTASEFERFQTILMTTEGSATAARDAMRWVQDFAVKTPYELDQVTDAFVKLRSYGLDPTHGLLQSLGDTSAAMGKPLGQAVEAIADAVTGENERLKEFGITASKIGNRIAYEYTNAAGETVRTAVEAGNRMAIQQTLMGIMNEKYAGSMERLSQTWDGMVSNVWDLWTKFQMMIMNAGLFEWMKGKLGEVLDTINRMEADGTLQEWATQISQTIQTALTNIWEFGKGIGEVIQQVSGYLSVASDYVGGWKNLSAILAGIAFAPTLISTAAGLVQIASGLGALSAALLANPIILIIAAIAGGVYLIYRNWDTIRPYFQRLWDGVKAIVSAVWDWFKSAFAWTPLGMIINNWAGIKDALSVPVELGKATIETVWAWFKTAFSWSPGALIASNWGSISSALSSPVETGKAMIDTLWSGLKALFTWSPGALIASNWGSISSALASPIETGKDLVLAAWESVKAVFAADWMPELPSLDWEALVNLSALQDAWESVTGWFGDAAAGLWDLIPEMPEFSLPGWMGGGDEIADPQTLLAAAEAAQKLEEQYPALTTAAQGALRGSQAAITSIHNLLSQADLTEHGARLMQTLADGIRSKLATVTSAAQEITRAIRAALPRSATMQIGVSGSAPVQKRARGGSFNPGWLLTGEEGAELEYRTRGGFIAHNRALQNMVAMSQTVARNAANASGAPGWLKGAALASGIAASAAMPAAALELDAGGSTEGAAPIGTKYLTERNAGGSTSVSAPITLTIQGNVDQSVMPDLKGALDELEGRLIARLEGAARAARRREHG